MPIINEVYAVAERVEKKSKAIIRWEEEFMEEWEQAQRNPRPVSLSVVEERSNEES